MTFNIRGLDHPINHKRVLTFLKRKRLKLSFCRKHICPVGNIKKLKKVWVGQVNFSSFTIKRRGTALLIHKNLPFIFKGQHNDLEGRYVLICGMLYGWEVTFLNIRAPNEDSPKFMIDNITLFSQYNKNFGIAAGDFNCCMNNNLDRTSSIASNPNAAKAIKI